MNELSVLGEGALEGVLEQLIEQQDILLPAFLAGLIILLSHIPLGQRVLNKGIIFFDLAIAQLSAFGVVLFSVLFSSLTHPLLVQLMAAGTAVGGALLLYRMRHLAVKLQEALIGILFMLSATGIMLLLAQDPHAGEKFNTLLLGQILWISYEDLDDLLLLTLGIGGLWWGLSRANRELAFYPCFALAITLSTQWIGVYLVFASLILPALVSQNSRSPKTTAFVLGSSSYLLGLVISALLDLPSGAVISWTLALTALGFIVLKHSLTDKHQIKSGQSPEPAAK
ncbi:MAG: zinc/manganese transporter permease [Oceanospirillum sp.]|nr:zinc/manganese transporter permease [Oceanospirillum sp.]